MDSTVLTPGIRPYARCQAKGRQQRRQPAGNGQQRDIETLNTSTLVLDYESGHAFPCIWLHARVARPQFGALEIYRRARRVRSTKSWGCCCWFRPGILGCTACTTGPDGRGDCYSAQLRCLFGWGGLFGAISVAIGGAIGTYCLVDCDHGGAHIMPIVTSQRSERALRNCGGQVVSASRGETIRVWRVDR